MVPWQLEEFVSQILGSRLHSAFSLFPHFVVPSAHMFRVVPLCDSGSICPGSWYPGRGRMGSLLLGLCFPLFSLQGKVDWEALKYSVITILRGIQAAQEEQC